MGLRDERGKREIFWAKRLKEAKGKKREFRAKR